MQVTSQKGNREIIHFQAPPKANLGDELSVFLNIFNSKPSEEMHGILRAAISHLWLIVSNA